MRPFAKVKSRTSLLRPGCDTLQPGLFLVPEEEEVSRSGARLLLQFRRARGADAAHSCGSRHASAWVAARVRVNFRSTELPTSLLQLRGHDVPWLSIAC